MKDFPKLQDFNFQNKTVLVRVDVDVPLREVQRGKGAEVQRVVEDDTRMKACLPTVEHLLDQKTKVILIGHLGRPNGKVVEELSLKPVAEKLKELLSAKRKVQSSKLQLKVQNFPVYILDENLWLLENLRFYPGEEKNDAEFAKNLSLLGDFYVNEAFAVSHREHASIVGVPKFLPHCAGLNFFNEVENLSKVLENPKRPVVFIIGGAKPETKLPMVAEFAKEADWVLVGGLLPNFKLGNVAWGDLTEDGCDINQETITRFVEIIQKAGTIVWNGPMGKFEVPEGSNGTKEIAEAIASSKAFKIVGGGDTIAALNKYKLLPKMDFVSLGGGAMLEFLASGSLPGIGAIKQR